MTEQHPEIDTLRGSKDFDKIILLDTNMEIENSAILLKKINDLLFKMTQ